MRLRAAVLLFSLVLATRGATGVALFGTILDPSGAVVPNAVVTAFNDDTGVGRTTSSDQEGFYAIAALPAGHYKVLVRKSGFLSTVRAGLNVGDQQNLSCDFLLRVGPMEETVTVEGNPTQFLAEPRTSGTILGRALMGQLPLGGRSLAGLLDLVPGMLDTPANTGEAGQFSANGERPNTNYFTVDGVSVNSGVSGAGIPGQFPGGTLPAMTAVGSLHNLAPLDAIEEVSVETSSFAPETGSMPGAQIAIATRTGSNNLHGMVFESFNHAALNANDWFANAAGLSRPAMRSNDLGGSLGGPMRRNRTFFFASLERIDVRQPLVWNTPVPSAAARANAPLLVAPLLAAFPLPNGPALGQGLAELSISTTRPAQVLAGSFRVDHELTSRVNLFGRYSVSPSWAEFGYSQINQSNFHESSLTAGVTMSLSPSLANDLRINASLASVESRWTGNSDGGAGPLNLSVTASGEVSFESFSINGVGSLNTGDAGRNSQNQASAVESLALVRGNHHFRFGADYQRLDPTREGPAGSVSLNYPSMVALLAAGAGSLTYAQSNSVATHLDTAAFFAQDNWTLHRRFTMIYGLRWEFAPAPSAPGAHPLYLESTATPLPGGHIWQGSYTNVEPRIGVAYRMSDDARSVLRAGFGVFYDASFGAATDEINGAPYNSWQTGTPYGSAPIYGGPAIQYGFANTLRLPRSLEWNLGWQHAWGDRASSTLSYVGSSGARLLRREGQIAPSPDLAELVLATSNGSSHYNGLEADYRQRLTGGFQAILSYTWSHSIDTGSWDSPVYLVAPGLTAASDRASSNFDVRQSFAAALSYTWCGWTLDSALRARGGFPIDVLAAETYDGLNFANVVRPDQVPGEPVWIGRSLNPAAFAIPTNGQDGDLGRNAIRGFGMWQLDLAFHRAWQIGQRATLELHAEFSNALNHSNLADPQRYLSSPLFGESTSMLNLMLGSGTPRTGLTPAFQLGGPRTIQLGLKVTF